MACTFEGQGLRHRQSQVGAGRSKAPKELGRETILSQKSTRAPSGLGSHRAACFDDAASSSTWQEVRAGEEDAGGALKHLRLPGQPLTEDCDELMDEDRRKDAEAAERQAAPHRGAASADSGTSHREAAIHGEVAVEDSAEHSKLAQLSCCPSDRIYLYDKTPSLSRCSSEEEIVEDRPWLEAETGRVFCVRSLTRVFSRGFQYSQEDVARTITPEEEYEKFYIAEAESDSDGEGRALGPQPLVEPSLPHFFFESGDLPHIADDDDELDDQTTTASLLRDDSFSQSLDDESWEAVPLEGVVPNSPSGCTTQSSSSSSAGLGRNGPTKTGRTRGPRAALGSLVNRASRMLRRQKARD